MRSWLQLEPMRVVQKKNLDLVVLYLVGAHLDDQLRAMLPNSTIVAFDDAKGLSPKNVCAELGLDRVRSLVLVGFSAGCGTVRSALVGDIFPVYERLGFVLIDGTHASLPAERWQIECWRKLGEEARRGEKLCVATCSNNVYTAKLAAPFMPTLHVVRQAFEPALFPATPPHEVHDNGLHLYAYASEECDKRAHAEQQTRVLPEMIRKHVRPWIDRSQFDGMVKESKSPLGVARGYVGWKEDGPNRGAIVSASLAGCVRDGRPIGIREGVPWCAGFVGLCDFEAHAEHTWRAAVHELVSDAVLAKTWREFGSYIPQPGDLAIFKRDGRDPRAFGEGHVDRVEVSPDASGVITTIGGNVGDAVVRRTWRIGEEARGNELVGWICRAGLTKDDRVQVDLAQRNLLRELLRIMVEA
jgi:CHAP domain